MRLGTKVGSVSRGTVKFVSIQKISDSKINSSNTPNNGNGVNDEGDRNESGDEAPDPAAE